MGASLIAVSHQTFGLAEFQRTYFHGEIYLDQEKSLYNAFGAKEGGAEDMSKPEVMAAGRKAYRMLKAKDPSYSLDRTGEGALLGGSLVVDSDGAIVYAHSEDTFGDIADPVALLDACRSTTRGSKL